MANLLARYYDCLTDWEKRLAREIPFLKRLIPGERVLVAGCGTGGHLPRLAEEGFQVTGIDADEEMAAAACSKIPAGASARVEQMPIENCSSLGQRFDAALCLGNVLPAFYGPNVMEAALQEMFQTLAPGGLFFTQNLNYDLRWREKQRFFPLLTGQRAGEEVIFFKFADYGGTHLDFHANFLVRKEGGRWSRETRTTRQRPVFLSDLRNACGLLGMKNLQCWGSFSGEPFDPQQSMDLLLAGWK